LHRAAPPAHRFKAFLEVADVGRDDQMAAGDLAGYEIGIEVFAARGESHFPGDLAPSGGFEMTHRHTPIRWWSCPICGRGATVIGAEHGDSHGIISSGRMSRAKSSRWMRHSIGIGLRVIPLAW
jgi:hypothetical protein